MRPMITVSLLSFMCSACFAQDSLKYDYAILNIIPARHKAIINYSNGGTRIMRIKLGPEMTDTARFFKADLTIFKGFELLNAQGFELTGMLLRKSSGALLYTRREYYFKRRMK